MRITVSENLFLETVEEKHSGQLFNLVDSNRAYLKEWMPWVDATAVIDDVMKFIADSQDQFNANNGFNTVISFNDELCGAIGLHKINWTDKNVIIGYWLSEDCQGNGIMTNSCRALVNYCFNELSLHRVEINCATTNYKSRAIPVRLGFTQEGILKESALLNGKFIDMVLYALINPSKKLGYTPNC